MSHKVIYFGVICMLFSFIIGCTKQDISNAHLFAPNEKAFTSVAVFNAIPNSTRVELSVRRDEMGKTMVTASDNLRFGGYLPYKNWYSGPFELEVFNKSESAGEHMKTAIDFKGGVFYSLFLYEKNGLKKTVSTDNVILPQNGKAKLRIAHLCDNLGNVRVFINNKKEPILKDIKYETISDYVLIDVFDIHMFVVEAQNGNAILELPITNNLNLKNKGVYTVLLKGDYAKNNGSHEQDIITLINQLE